MVIPGLVGLWIDRSLGWLPVVFTLLGFGLGMTVGIMHLLRIAAALGESEGTKETNHADEDR
jgi:hypothetical protein